METKQKRRKVVVSLLALVGLLGFLALSTAGDLEPSGPPGPTMKTLDEVEPRIPIHASDLPLTITEPNSYYLVEDVNFEPNDVHAITIECNDVTIDLMGYTLKGPDSGSGSGIYMNGRSNVEIRNGTVRDFGDCGIRAAAIGGKGHRVIAVRAVSNGGTGIDVVTGNISHSVIRDCTVAGNGGFGIATGMASMVTGNRVYDNNGIVGIEAYNGSTVTGNTVRNNQGHGILAVFSTVTGNSVSANQLNGIWAEASTVTGNSVSDNQGDGILTQWDSTVTGNTVYNNLNNGIYASSSMVAGNTVSLNNGSNGASYAGIKVVSESVVKGNTVEYCKRNNIYVTGGENAIQENLVTDSTGNGIYVSSSGNIIIKNTAATNSTNYNIVAGNSYGPIVNVAGVGDISGTANANHPWANFEF